MSDVQMIRDALTIWTDSFVNPPTEYHAALDRLVAERDALLHQRKVATDWAAELAVRAEAAEKERDAERRARKAVIMGWRRTNRKGGDAMIQVDTSSNFHPYECDGIGKCVHCDRRKVVYETQGTRQVDHDPATCALCDPEYDMRPNPHWKTAGSMDRLTGGTAPPAEEDC